MEVILGGRNMAKAIGVGGLFLEFKGKKEDLHKFYMDHLGLDMTDYGSGFIQGEQLMLLSFKRDFENVPLINFRVDDLEAIMEKLRSLNLETDEIADYEYGKFAHFTDPFGNYIELWQAHEENYKKMVEEEIKNYKKQR
jgi:predicted enzyme related to lactoylglutathione lyase